MSRDSRYDVLFEPVQIGPVTAPNRFYQVPHCSGMGYALPKTLAAMRGVKAEGGWGVVNTEYCSIHPTSDNSPYQFASIWDEGDVRNLHLAVEQVHRHGSLAGVELWYGGSRVSNLSSRMPPLGVSSMPSASDPVQSASMTKADIKRLRCWHTAAAKRAMRAGFDIVYVYATHGYLLSEFLSAECNTRSDEYGGSLENRVRLVRELIEETKQAVGHKCAVAVRFAADANAGQSNEEQREMLAMLAHLPDLWDINIENYDKEMGSARFVKEGELESHVSYVHSLTDKPVVGVGRFTSPDTMVRMIKQGVLDLIGAARPSIADPFLPLKIEQGRLDEIRECIGCNICYAHDSRGSPIRCTQNPTIGEEWRRGWHPEHVPPKQSAEAVLIVGAGPAGLEAAYILGKRGYPVTLAEAGTELGGRLSRESRLPGLSETARVRDYRVQQIAGMPNVGVYPDNPLAHRDVLDFGCPRVLIATGAYWRKNGMGRHFISAVQGYTDTGLYSPDDIMANSEITGPVVVFDDDNYYMGTVIAEKMRMQGHAVTYVTSQGRAGDWSTNTEEQFLVQKRLLELGVTILTDQVVCAFDGSRATVCCIYTQRESVLPARAFVPVTSRAPRDGLYHRLASDPAALEKSGITMLRRIGDCLNPGIIAAAVHAGHLAGRTIDEPGPDDGPYLRDRVIVNEAVR